MLRELYLKCIESEDRYIHTAEGGDYLIEYDNGTIYLLFEWSDGREDWISNFDFPITPYKRMDEKWYCHRGFLRVWKSMRDSIELEVNKLRAENDISKIVCIGYSHGAAIAVLATEDMAYICDDNIKVEGYGFGCPRVFWGNIPQGLKTRLKGFRAIQNYKDIVTHVPPSAFGFKHINPVTIKVGKYNPVDAHRQEAYLETLW